MAHEWAKALAIVALLASLLSVAMGTAIWSQSTPAIEDLTTIADQLFGDWVFAFELLSVLLLGALFGSLYLAMKPKPGEDSE